MNYQQGLLIGLLICLLEHCSLFVNQLLIKENMLLIIVFIYYICTIFETLQAVRIYLVGYMGAGKSTTAKRLARRLGMEAYDTDQLFEERYHISASDFFKKYDENLYRRLETQILHDTVNYEHAVIATGGGTACFNGNMEWMNQHGITIFLKISPQTAINRLSQSKVRRPLVFGKPMEELTAFIQQCYAERMPLYEQAQLTFKGEDCDLDALTALIPTM